MRMRGILQV